MNVTLVYFPIVFPNPLLNLFIFCEDDYTGLRVLLFIHILFRNVFRCNNIQGRINTRSLFICFHGILRILIEQGMISYIFIYLSLICLICFIYRTNLCTPRKLMNNDFMALSIRSTKVRVFLFLQCFLSLFVWRPSSILAGRLKKYVDPKVLNVEMRYFKHKDKELEEDNCTTL